MLPVSVSWNGKEQLEVATCICLYGIGHQKYRYSFCCNAHGTQSNTLGIRYYQYYYVCAPIFAGETTKFNMTFISLRNTPLDVYFLTDVSASLQFSINALRGGINDIGML